MSPLARMQRILADQTLIESAQIRRIPVIYVLFRQNCDRVVIFCPARSLLSVPTLWSNRQRPQ